MRDTNKIDPTSRTVFRGIPGQQDRFAGDTYIVDRQNDPIFEDFFIGPKPIENNCFLTVSVQLIQEGAWKPHSNPEIKGYNVSRDFRKISPEFRAGSL